jgi:hypothetical protein
MQQSPFWIEFHERFKESTVACLLRGMVRLFRLLIFSGWASAFLSRLRVELTAQEVSHWFYQCDLKRFDR